VSPGARWIAAVVGLLVGNAIAMGVLLAEAGDPTPRVLPDYYRRAIAWDDTMAARRASAALGWTATPTLDGDRVAVVLVDAAGAPVSGATVTVTARHRSRADGVVAATLDEAAPGRYLGDLALARPGLHELEVTARRAGATFLASALVER
jgi:nitrogen fixation protein FixH